MADNTVQLDPVIRDGLVAYFKKRLGLFGALGLEHAMEKCTCEPCSLFRSLVAGTDVPAHL